MTDFKLNITDEVIDKLSEIANQRPNERIVFMCKSTANFVNIENKPKNLSIIFTDYL